MLTEDLTGVSPSLQGGALARLAESYKQLNASVGRFGTSTLIAATNAIESGSPSDFSYTLTDRFLSLLEQARDHLANAIKNELNAAAFDRQPINRRLAAFQTAESEGLQFLADLLAQHQPGGQRAAGTAR